jgi:hypothetical protein
MSVLGGEVFYRQGLGEYFRVAKDGFNLYLCPTYSESEYFK